MGSPHRLPSVLSLLVFSVKVISDYQIILPCILFSVNYHLSIFHNFYFYNSFILLILYKFPSCIFAFYVITYIHKGNTKHPDFLSHITGQAQSSGLIFFLYIQRKNLGTNQPSFLKTEAEKQKTAIRRKRGLKTMLDTKIEQK